MLAWGTALSVSFRMVLVEPLITDVTTISASTPMVIPSVETIETKEMIWLFLRVRI